ncbi:trans-Golgi network integral membrane protein 1 isoform X3 [Cherax quadricarinatus]
MLICTVSCHFRLLLNCLSCLDFPVYQCLLRRVGRKDLESEGWILCIIIVPTLAAPPQRAPSRNNQKNDSESLKFEKPNSTADYQEQPSDSLHEKLTERDEEFSKLTEDVDSDSIQEKAPKIDLDKEKSQMEGDDSNQNDNIQKEVDQEKVDKGDNANEAGSVIESPLDSSEKEGPLDAGQTNSSSNVLKSAVTDLNNTKSIQNNSNPSPSALLPTIQTEVPDEKKTSKGVEKVTITITASTTKTSTTPTNTTTTTMPKTTGAFNAKIPPPPPPPNYPPDEDEDTADTNSELSMQENDRSYDDDEGINEDFEDKPTGNENVPQKVDSEGKFSDDEDSHFFAYFLTIMITAIIFYLVFHNKQRIIALIIEGRAPSSSRNRRSSSRAKYHKLDNNLEEAITATKGSK